MAMSDRQIQKEILRLKKEIDLLEGQIQSGLKSKADKEQENKRIEDDIKIQDEENKSLADQFTKLESSISDLDGEFKDNQLKAGRIRKEMNIIKEDLEKKNKEEKSKQDEIEMLLTQLEDLKKKIKEEKRSKENADYNLRKTNAKVAEIQSHWASKVVTSKIQREAKKSGGKAGDIKRSEEDIKAYKQAVQDGSRINPEDSDEETSEESAVIKPGTEKTTAPKTSEKKDAEKSGLDLDY
jgi:chromosome segregation ATPase